MIVSILSRVCKTYYAQAHTNFKQVNYNLPRCTVPEKLFHFLNKQRVNKLACFLSSVFLSFRKIKKNLDSAKNTQPNFNSFSFFTNLQKKKQYQNIKNYS